MFTSVQYRLYINMAMLYRECYTPRVLLENRGRNVPVKSKLKHTPGYPRAFEFLGTFYSNPPLLTGPKNCSNAPTPGKMTRLLFKLFSSFYFASEAVHVNTAY